MKSAFSLVFVFAIALAFSFASVALAQVPPQNIGSIPTGGGGIGEGGGVGVDVADTAGLVEIIINLVNWVAWIVGLVAVVMGLWAGILFITAGGDAAKVTTARNILLYAIIGIAVAILAFSLVAIARAFLIV
ncbi:MAG: hypothetical protein AAB581_02100 [Patescibacteria group bacterium]